MNTASSRPGLGLIQFVLSVLAVLAATVISGLILGPFSTLAAPTHPAWTRLLVGMALVQGPALLFFVSGSRLHGWRLWGLSLVVYIGAAQVLAHFETVAFNFLFQFTLGQMVFLMGSQALTAMILVPLIVTIAGKWNPSTSEDRVGPWLPRGAKLWIRIGLLSATWYFTYMTAGFFIADPITHDYYAAKIADLDSINAWLPGLQLVRGFLWTLLFVLAVGVMNRPLPEAGLLAGLLFGAFHAAGLLLPSSFMPAEMRLSHLPEIVLSLVWQGVLTVSVLSWKKKETALN